MNILIVNQPPFNRGDESAHKGLIRSLLQKIPNVQIKIMYEPNFIESIRQYNVGSTYVKYVQEPTPSFKFAGFVRLGLCKGIKFPWYFHPTFIKYRKIYDWADIVMCAPGGICMGGFQKWDHVFRLQLAKFFNKPLVYYGRSFGPFPTKTKDNRLFRKKSLEMLKYFSFLAIRDHKSELLAQELGISYHSTVDSAFLDSPKVELPYEIKKTIGETPYMVFVPNYLRWHFAYKETISHQAVIDFYSRVMDEMWQVYPNCNIVMLPQTFCESRYEFDDIRLFRELAEKKNDTRVIVVPNCYSSDIQQTIINKAKLLVGARYHSIVFALNQAVPFIALSYEHKIIGLLESLDKTNCCIDFTHTLENKENQEIAIHEIREKLSFVSSDKYAQNKAKAIAGQCMSEFVESLPMWTHK